MRISVMDYGVGNLHSISKGIERAGARVRVISNPKELLDSECIVFPGVGAFGAAMDTLRPILPRLRERIASGVPTIGVCLGMQILFEKSEESPGEGVAVLKGEVLKLKGPRVPQMGWNDVVRSDDALFEGIPDRTQFYFANSYICRPAESVEIAESEYGERFPSAVRKGNTYGVQFHPEKSGAPGLRLLSNFVRLAEESM
ncbi:MAG: imidazole glycerol phosphate synthase, glutamine amidotransferase subunit [Euryarchaeota archaeon RBG_19FT_COMBO_56_21]|nr:MAG: imidazole glycerol phosphate synthase, glutamine amidotransferase subunit [Euryarchaeota archaeon RBG_19FT_COMBO_56_21]